MNQMMSKWKEGYSNLNNKVKIGIRVILGALFVIALFYMTYRKLLCADLDADFSSLTIESNDFVSGNFFLKGWNQTGISFLLTDFLFFAIGAQLFGFCKSAYVFGMTLMIGCAFLSGALLIKYRSKLNIALYIALAAFPSITVVGLQRAHTGGFIWTFIALAIFAYAIEKAKMSKVGSAAVIILFAMCGVSDMATVLFGAAAVLFVVIYKEFFDQRIDRKFYGKIAGITITGIIIGFMMDKAYYAIGGCNKNGFMGGKAFEFGGNIVDKVFTYINCVLTLNNSELYSGPVIFSVKGIFSSLYAFIAILGVILVIKNVIEFIQSKDEDFVSTVLSVGYLLIGIAFIFTNIGIDIFTSRYFAVQQIIFAILICRRLSNRELYERRFYTSRIAYKYIVGLMIAGYTLIGLYSVIRYTGEEFITPAESLGAYLAEQGLESGYGNYWDCAPATVSSEGKTKVRAITIDDGNTANPFWWFCKDEWYKEYANFVVIDDVDQQEMGITEEKVTAKFGMPERVLYHNSYIIYVYEYDLSSKVEFGNK